MCEYTEKTIESCVRGIISGDMNIHVLSMFRPDQIYDFVMRMINISRIDIINDMQGIIDTFVSGIESQNGFIGTKILLHHIQKPNQKMPLPTAMNFNVKRQKILRSIVSFLSIITTIGLDNRSISSFVICAIFKYYEDNKTISTYIDVNKFMMILYHVFVDYYFSKNDEYEEFVEILDDIEIWLGIFCDKDETESNVFRNIERYINKYNPELIPTDLTRKSLKTHSYSSTLYSDVFSMIYTTYKVKSRALAVLTINKKLLMRDNYIPFISLVIDILLEFKKTHLGTIIHGKNVLAYCYDISERCERLYTTTTGDTQKIIVYNSKNYDQHTFMQYYKIFINSIVSNTKTVSIYINTILNCILSNKLEIKYNKGMISLKYTDPKYTDYGTMLFQKEELAKKSYMYPYMFNITSDHVYITDEANASTVCNFKDSQIDIYSPSVNKYIYQAIDEDSDYILFKYDRIPKIILEPTSDIIASMQNSWLYKQIS